MSRRASLVAALLLTLTACSGTSIGADWTPSASDSSNAYDPSDPLASGREPARPTKAPPSQIGDDDAGSTPSTGSGDGSVVSSADAGVDVPPPPAPPPPPLPPVVPDAKRIFETSHYFSGDLKTEGWGTTGLEGADNLCNSAALVANLGNAGAWRAWLSVPGTNAVDRIADVSPWYLVDQRTQVFASKFGLGQGALVAQVPGVEVGPLVHLEMNEFGVVNSPVSDWTGTDKHGIVSPSSCDGWTGLGGEGLVGIGSTWELSWWTDSVTHACSMQGRLICFEQ